MMPRLLFPLLLCMLLPVACVSQRSHFVSITDLPLKTTKLESMSWQVSPIRAHAQYVLYGANSSRERRNRLGDYYFVEWYDAEPELPVKLEMLYTQALTASQVLSRTVQLDEPRSSSGTRKTHFFFNGPERARRGDILTWRLNLYVDGELVDSRHSFLWQDELNTEDSQSLGERTRGVQHDLGATGAEAEAGS